MESDSFLGRQLIELNEKSYQQILKKVTTRRAESKSEVVKRYFVALITETNPGGGTNNSSRHLTIETINRYIFCLNLVNNSEHGHISELVVRSQIKCDLEKNKNHEMDKKTLRRIIENLKRDELIKTKDFQIQIKP